MCFLGFTVSSSPAELENKTKKNHSCQTLVVFFLLNLKRRSEMWSNSEWLLLCFLKLLCCGALTCSQWHLSPPEEFTVTLLDSHSFDLTFSVSACAICFFSPLLPLHPITLCSLPSSYAGILIFHNSPLLLQCLHLLFTVISAEYKIINWYNSLKWNCFF